MNAFLKLFRSIEARMVAEEALEYTALGGMKRAASYWSMAYEMEKFFRENEQRSRASEK